MSRCKSVSVFIAFCLYVGLPLKIQTVVHRCVLLGCDIPSEPTCGHIVGTMLSLAKMDLDRSDAHYIIVDFKRALRTAFRNQVGDSSITDFPAEPSQLPQQRLQFAYKSGLPEKVQNVTHAPNLPLRRSASSVKGSSSSGQLAQPSNLIEPTNFFLQLLAGASAASHTNRNHCFSNSINLQMLRRPSSLSSTSNSPDSLQTSPLMAITNGNAMGVVPSGSVHPTPPSECTPPSRVLPGGESPALAPAQSCKGSDVSIFQFPDMTPEHQSKVVADAMAKRADARKEEADEEANASMVKGTMKSCLKRPAAATKSTGKTKKVSFVEPKAAAKAAGPFSSKAAFKRPPVPMAGSGTHFYRGGKIHESTRKEAWRVFRKTGDRVDKASFLFPPQEFKSRICSQ